jgi:hypothetical protein
MGDVRIVRNFISRAPGMPLEFGKVRHVFQ